MIKTFSACTTEIDDVGFAVNSIIEQLDYEGKLLKNSVGVISCFAEFIESGVVDALCGALPFDVLGATTIACAGAGKLGETMLCLLVITSDDVEFVTGTTGPVLEEDPSVLRSAYEEAARGRNDKPSLMLCFTPLLFDVSCDFFVESMDEITGGVPVFGMRPVDHNADYHESYVIFNGSAARDCFAFALFYGGAAPRFYTGTISDDKIFSEEASVTGSSGVQIQSINGKSVTEYLLSLGLTQNENGAIAGINSFPVIVNYNDGTEPAMLAMFAMTPEGYAVCSGRAPAGSMLSIGKFSTEEIIATSANTLDRVLDGTEYKAVIIFSCIGRYFSLRYSQFAEIEMTVSKMKNSSAAYLMAYSGGEICPVYNKEGKHINRSHSNTFVICAF